MPSWVRALLVAVSLCAPGAGIAANGTDAYDPAILSTCLAQTPTESAEICIGIAAESCSQSAGGTTVGMGFCYGAELKQWDGLLNEAYGRLKASHQASEGAGDYDHLGDMFPRPVIALRDMQRSWIPFRDAACVHEFSQWGGGTGGTAAEVACLMRLTARQTLWLQGYLDRWTQ